MAQNQIYKQLSPYNFFRIEVITRTGTAFQRMRAVKGVKLKKNEIDNNNIFIVEGQAIKNAGHKTCITFILK